MRKFVLVFAVCLLTVALAVGQRLAAVAVGSAAAAGATIAAAIAVTTGVAITIAIRSALST